jgi:hypothetical protein
MTGWESAFSAGKIGGHLSSSWPGLSGPPIPARAATGGPDRPGHDDWGIILLSAGVRTAAGPRASRDDTKRRLPMTTAARQQTALHLNRKMWKTTA